MESKRIKLDNEDEDSQGSNSLSSHSSEERGASSTAATSFDQLKSANPSEVEKDMKRLKAALRSKSAVQDFVKQHPENFSVVVNVFLKAVSNNVGKGPPWPSILKDSISVIANCCNYSVNACVKMTSSKISLSHAAVRIFENTSIKQDCKTSMARLIANMCTHRESANYIASNASLVDRLVLLLESEDDATATQALRAVRGLVGNSNVKSHS
ncbi:hypothetical protein Q1695_009216 [Nippostrongylus brasiliensis]|nr:hypothetical protein Q1695_009216 [Nippostrongylus brasiliensis]